VFRKLFGVADRLQDKPVGFGVWVCGLLSLIAVRNILESFSGGIPLPEQGTHFLHYPFALIVALLALVLLLALFANLPVVKPTRLILYPWTLILLPPVLDLIIPGKQGSIIGYVPASQRPWWVLTAFFNPWAEGKLITAGVRIEYFVGCLLAAIYIRHYSRSWVRALVGFLCIYTVAVALAMKPGLYLAVFGALGVTPSSRWVFISHGSVVRHMANRYSYSLALIDVFNLAVLLAIWLRAYSRRLWNACWKEARVWEPLAAVVGFWAGARAFFPGQTLRQAFTHPLDILAAAAVVLSSLLLVMAARHLGASGTRPLAVVELLLGLSAALCVNYACLAMATALLGVLLLVEYGPFLARDIPLIGAVGSGAGLVFAGLMGFCVLHGMNAPLTLKPGLLGVVLILGALSHTAGKWPALRWFLGAVALAALFWSSSARHDPSPRSMAVGYRAQAFERDYEFDHAIVDYAEALELGRQEPDIIYALAFLKAQRGETDDALSLYDRLLAVRPDHAMAVYQKGRILSSTGADPESLYRMALAIDPDLKDAIRSLATLLLAQERYSEALVRFEGLSDLEPRMALPHNGAALALEGLGKVPEAEQRHRTAVELDPDDPVLRLNLARLLARTGRSEEALSELDRLPPPGELATDVLTELAELRQGLGDGGGSVALYNEVVAREPGDFSVVLRAGIAHDQAGRRKEARELFKRASRIRPGSPEPHHNLGISLMGENRLEEAREAFARAAELAPENPSPWYHLAVVVALAGRLDEATPFLEKAVSLGGPRYAAMARGERALRRVPVPPVSDRGEE
jgi:Flp pilus assembly protein TadD